MKLKYIISFILIILLTETALAQKKQKKDEDVKMDGDEPIDIESIKLNLPVDFSDIIENSKDGNQDMIS